MKGGLIFLAALAALVVAFAAWRGGVPLILQGLERGGRESLTLVPLLIVVFVLAGFVQVLLPKDVVAGWLSAESGWRGIGVAWLAGLVTPGGGPIGIPLAAALYKAGAGAGVVVTYLTSMSLLSFIRLPMEAAMYGTRLTFTRAAASLLLPPLAGFIAERIASQS